jgi:membrane-anchored protein YejM (alkaline phosphatase superfamily)
LGIYDRRTGELTLDSRNNYLDNLELVDRALGETRRAMEATGCWENSTILVTSDHPLRPSAWNQEFSWSREEAAVTGNKEYPWVPFLVKVAGQRRPVTYDPPFNTVLIHDLTVGFMRGQLSTAEDTLRWLDQNRSRAPLQLAPPE